MTYSVTFLAALVADWIVICVWSMASKTGHSPEMSWVKTGEGGRGRGVEQLTESVVSLSVSSMRPDIDEVEMRKNAVAMFPTFCCFQWQNAGNKT